MNKILMKNNIVVNIAKYKMKLKSNFSKINGKEI